jgi:hypothetical protein
LRVSDFRNPNKNEKTEKQKTYNMTNKFIEVHKMPAGRLYSQAEIDIMSKALKLRDGRGKKQSFAIIAKLRQ